jgi:hypothetical protein
LFIFFAPKRGGETNQKKGHFFEGFFTKDLQKPAIKSYLEASGLQGFIRQPAETLFMAFTDEKELAISILATIICDTFLSIIKAPLFIIFRWTSP